MNDEIILVPRLEDGLVPNITTNSIIDWTAKRIPFLSALRPTPILKLHFFGIEMRSRKWRVKNTLLQLRAWLAATNLRSYDFMIVYYHASHFFPLPANILLLLCRKNGPGTYYMSARLGKQHIDLVNPIIDFTSVFITGGLTTVTSAWKRNFGHKLVNTKD
jgi:hypothetical protein